ncbi:MAG TPA: peptidylprolyl isomerase [Chitinophagaceae bacterium]|nr:peptidylprolyl isomerase [Chitinophagaceae bacterium]
MKKAVLLLVILFAMNSTLFAKKEHNTFVEVNTNKGVIVLEIFSDVPQHSANFLKLVKENFYDSLLFHRVIPQFMIQGGDPNSKNALVGQFLGSGDIGYKIPAEIMIPTHFHRKGALAAARDNNPDKASSACQFYIVVGKTFNDDQLNSMEVSNGVKYTEEMRTIYKTEGGTPHLDGGYTVFGQTVSGQEIVDEISNVSRDATDRPKEDVMIFSTKILKKWKPKN